MLVEEALFTETAFGIPHTANHHVYDSGDYDRRPINIYIWHRLLLINSYILGENPTLLQHHAYAKSS